MTLLYVFCYLLDGLVPRQMSKVIHRRIPALAESLSLRRIADAVVLGYSVADCLVLIVLSCFHILLPKHYHSYCQPNGHSNGCVCYPYLSLLYQFGLIVINLIPTAAFGTGYKIIAPYIALQIEVVVSVPSVRFVDSVAAYTF